MATTGRNEMKALHQNKAVIANQLFHALIECNLAGSDSLDDSGEWVRHNNIPAHCSGQQDAYGHISNAIKCLGYEAELIQWVETGDAPDIR